MKTLCVRVSRLTGNLASLAFRGEFGSDDIGSALRVIQVHVDESTANDKFIDRIASVADALKAKGIVCEVIIEN